MLKIEKKLVLWVEKHMFLLMVLLVAAIGLYLRRMAIWWGNNDISFYFDRHENNIQPSFYHFIVYLFQYIPMLPLHTMKWFAGLADYVVAVLFIAAMGGHKEHLKLKPAFCFVVCILSPVVYLRGICWAQVDSVAFAFLLGGYILWEKGKKIQAAILAIPGVAIYPCFLLLVLGWMAYRREYRRCRDWLCLGILAAGMLLLQGITGLVIGQTWTESFRSCVNWMTYEPHLGTEFSDPLSWGKQMVNLFGYSAALLSGMAAYRRKIPYVAALLIHLAVLLVYGSMLFPASV